MANNVNISLLLRTKGFTKGLANAKKQLTTFGQVSQTVGRTLQYALGGALIAVGADAAKAAADFDLANRKLKALSGPEAAASVEGLADTARQLGKNSIFTAAEVANLQVEMKKLGLSSKDVQKLSEVTVKFATAMDTDAAGAGATLVKTLNKFKSSFDQYETKADAATKLSEQMANAVLNSALTFETLQSSLNFAGGEAEAAGFSFSETTAILAKLADAGFEGSRAGTILRRIFINLAKTGAVDINKAFGDLIENQQEFADLIKITGARSAGGIASIQGLKDAIAEFAAANEDATGQIDGLFNAVDQSLIGRVKNLRSAIQELGIVFEKQFGRQLRDLISGLAEWIRSIDATDAKAVGIGVTFIALTKILRGLKTVVTNLAIAFVGRGGIGGLAKAFLRLGPGAPLIAGAVAGFAIIKSEMNDFKNNVIRTTQALKDMEDAFGAALSPDDSFSKKLAEKSFGSEKEFRDAAQSRLENLSIALEKGREAIADDEFANFSIGTKGINEVMEALRGGATVTELIAAFKKNQKDGIISGLNNEEEIDKYRAFLNKTKNLIYYESELVKLRELLTSGIGKGENIYWKTVADEGGDAVPVIRDVIKAFEDLNAEGLDRNGDGAINTYRELSATLKELEERQRALNKEEAEAEGRGQGVSDDLKQRMDDNDKLLEYYESQLEIIEAQNKSQEEIADNAVRRTAFEQKIYEWKEKQKQKQEEIQARIRQENKEIAEMVGLGQTLVGVFNNIGFSVRESITLANGLLLGLINQLNDAFSSFADTFARALVDPAQKMGEAMKEWGKQMLATLVSAIVKIGLLTAAIALGNKFTGGGVTALLKVLAKNGQNFGGGVQLANTLAGGGDLSASSTRTTGYISGSDLVLGTSRGINARDRIYG
jgi:hypothetical protein